MSLKTFVVEEEKKIKHAFQNMEPELQKLAVGSISLTTALEKGLTSDTAEEIAAILDTAFPGAHAETIRETAIGACEAVTPELKLVAQGGTVEKGALLMLAAKVAQIYHSGKFSIGTYIQACQTAYDHKQVV